MCPNGEGQEYSENSHRPPNIGTCLMRKIQIIHHHSLEWLQPCVFWYEFPKYLGKATINVAIWLKHWTFCPEFPKFSGSFPQNATKYDRFYGKYQLFGIFLH